MSLDCGRKPENPEKTHANTGRTRKLHTEGTQTTFEPATLLLWGDSANHDTTVVNTISWFTITLISHKFVSWDTHELQCITFRRYSYEQYMRITCIYTHTHTHTHTHTRTHTHTNTWKSNIILICTAQREKDRHCGAHAEQSNPAQLQNTMA